MDLGNPTIKMPPAIANRMLRSYSNTKQHMKISHSIWKKLVEYARNPQTIQFEIQITYLPHGDVFSLNVVNRIHNWSPMQDCLPADGEALQELCKFIWNETMLSTNCATTSTSTPPAASFTIDANDLHSNGCYTGYNYDYNTGVNVGSLTDYLIKSDYVTKSECDKRHCGCGHVLNEDVNEKEKKSMFNFDFGKVTSNTIRYSTYGLAVQSVDGHYVSYDQKTGSVMDVDILNMPANDFLYKMPVAVKDVKVGDVIIHNRVPMFVKSKTANGLRVVDIREATEKDILPVKSPFGFNFVTKVVSIIDMGSANADTPFGNILPFLMMKDGKMDSDMLLPMMMMNQKSLDMSNPMMLLMLKDSKMNDATLMAMMMMMMQKPAETQKPVVERPVLNAEEIVH